MHVSMACLAFTALRQDAPYEECGCECEDGIKFREYGKEFFEGVNIRYHQYAGLLSDKLKMPVDYIQGMIYIFVRACVHYALFGDEDYLQLQLNAIRISLKAYTDAGNIGG